MEVNIFLWGSELNVEQASMAFPERQQLPEGEFYLVLSEAGGAQKG